MRPSSRVLAPLVVAVVLMSCGGDDGASEQTSPPASARGTFPLVTSASSPSVTTSSPSASSPSSDAATTAVTTAVTTAIPGGLRITLDELAEVEQPVAFAVRAGDDRLYVVAQAGQVSAIRDGQIVADPVLDITDRVRSRGEQGLLGLAYSLDGTKAYVNYTLPTGDAQVDEYAVGADGIFDVASRRELLTVPHRENANHNGGSTVVGADGLLYLGFGDGGGGGDPFRAGQDPGTFLGKILRIDPIPSAGQPYTIPTDNPFAGVDGVRPEIWSYGLRNPWRFSFDRQTGDLWIGDVGQGDVEEIDTVSAADGAGAGANFGWSAYEGTNRYNEDQTADNHTPPIYEYPHTDGNASVTGGYVYRGSAIPAMFGIYLFGDYGSGRIWALSPSDEDRPDVTEIANLPGLSSFGEDQQGELYALSVAQNKVYRIVAG